MKIKAKMLVAVYLIMLGICIVLTTISNFDITSTIINCVIFAIIGVIFREAEKLLSYAETIENELLSATKQIKEDYEKSNMLLLNQYKCAHDNIFSIGILKKQYDSYMEEVKRLDIISNGGYKCNISDYVSKEFIDSCVKKNLLNLIPGTMTGLGILGTFIGLSFGLQGFNTGSADEITNSIAPLMNGIKVAFHTSIYGMIFSLFFNFVYKNIMEDTYLKLDEFIEAYNNYVSGESIDENESKLIAVVQGIPEQVGAQLSNMLEPTLERMNVTLSTLSTNVYEGQLKGVETIVNTFVEEMNKSLGDGFNHLGEVLEETSRLQEQNSAFMKDILEKIGKMTQNIIDINELTDKTIESLSSYIGEIEKLQSIINENFMSVNIQLDEHNQIEERMQKYIDTLVEYEKQISEASKAIVTDITGHIENMARIENEISEGTRHNIEAIANSANEYNKTVSEVAQKQIENVLYVSQNITGNIDKSTNEFTNTIGRMEKNISEGTKQNIEMLAITAEQYNKTLAESAMKQIDAVIQTSQNTTGDMDRASRELSKVSQQLNGQIIDSLNTTFDCFDQNLAEITKHLSGTISEVDATINRVPSLVVASYDGMEKSFGSMQNELEGMIHALDIMQRNLQRWADKMGKPVIDGEI